MPNIIVTGCGTEVGKTLVAAIIVTAVRGDYWKPIQCGSPELSDSKILQEWISSKQRIYSSAYSLNTPLSPHHAARLEGLEIDPNNIKLPKTCKPLIIETAGGIFVPLQKKLLALDIFQKWEGVWIVVSRHYIGSINHTLLTLEILKQKNLFVGGIIFNGPKNEDTEDAILHCSQVPCLGRLAPEKNIDKKTIKKYANLWKPAFGTLLHR